MHLVGKHLSCDFSPGPFVMEPEHFPLQHESYLSRYEWRIGKGGMGPSLAWDLSPLGRHFLICIICQLVH